jgi:hypothetical protein
VKDTVDSAAQVDPIPERTCTMTTKLILTSIAFLSLAASIVNGAEKGAVIAKKDLPASITAKSAKTAKHSDSIPSCAKGRLVSAWGDIAKADGIEKVDTESHPCFAENEIYVCRAFGKLSIRCENPAK